MKARFLFFLLVCFPFAIQAQFDSLFTTHSLRIDYVHAGTDKTEWVALEGLSEEAFWGGSATNLIDTLRYGKYFFEVFDTATKQCIYSRGFSSLFGEWQTTPEAKVNSRSFSESLLMPFPKMPVKVLLYSRLFSGKWDTIFRLDIDPANYFIQPVRKAKWPVFDVFGGADPAHAVDIVILPDGYTMDELGKFIDDSRRLAESLLAFEPYKQLKERFRIRAVLAPSAESGIAVPADHKWPETVLSSSFYTFDSERYCMTYDNKSVRNLAGQVPYDQIYILANTTKYGGGGIFNFYSLSASGNALSSKIIVHEFGHAFAGLGDEYYDSSTSYSDFYNPDVEPWEPNLTTLVDFDSKWKSLMDKDTPIPTPAADSMKTVLGVFEGGGYVAHGVYRPKMDCLMKTFNGEVFCEACNRAIINMIHFYSD